MTQLCKIGGRTVKREGKKDEWLAFKSVCESRIRSGKNAREAQNQVRSARGREVHSGTIYKQKKFEKV